MVFFEKMKDLGRTTKTAIWFMLSFNSFWSWRASLFNISSWLWKSIRRTEKISKLFHPGRFSNSYRSLIGRKRHLVNINSKPLESFGIFSIMIWNVPRLQMFRNILNQFLTVASFFCQKNSNGWKNEIFVKISKSSH